MRAVTDRGRAEYRLTVADTALMIVAGVTADGGIGIARLRETVASLIGR